MYGLITQVHAQPGMRERLSELLVDGLSNRPGLLSYTVSDDGRSNALWVSEVWKDEETYRSAIETPWFKAFVAGARPMFAEVCESVIARAA